MIGFALREGSIRLDISLQAAERAGLVFHPALRQFKFAHYY